MPIPVQQNQSLEQIYTAFIENMCKVSGKPEMAKPLIEGFDAYYNARLQPNPMLESWIGDKAKKWIKIGIIPALLINGQVQKVLEKHRAEDEYKAVKAQVEDTLDDLTTIDVRVPWDISGWNTNDGKPRGWHTVQPRYYGVGDNKPYDEYNSGTCGHAQNYSYSYSDSRLTIEDLLKDAASCLSFCNDTTVKDAAESAIEWGTRLRSEVSNYLNVVDFSFDRDWESWEERHPDDTRETRLDNAKQQLKRVSERFAQAMQKYLDMRTAKYGDSEADRIEQWMHTEGNEPNFKASHKNCRVPFTAVRTSKYKDTDGKIIRGGSITSGNDSMSPDEDKFYKGRHPHLER